MKKYFAIILALIFVLGLSPTVNAASFDVSGTINIGGMLYSGDWFWVYALEGEAAFSQEFSDAALLSMVLGVNVENGFSQISFSTDFTYNISPTFKLMAIYDSGGIVYFSGPVFGYWAFGENLAIVAINTFAGGSVIGVAGVQMPFAFGMAGNYSTGPITVGGFFEYENMDAGAYLTYMATDHLALSGEIWYHGGSTYFGGSLAYKATDNLALSGEIRYHGGSTYFGGSLAYAGDTWAFNAEYDTLYADVSLDGSVVVIPELLMLKGFLAYNLDFLAVEAIGIEADVALNKSLMGYVAYEYYAGDSDYIATGLSWKLDRVKTINADYVYDVTGDEAVLSLVLEIAF